MAWAIIKMYTSKCAQVDPQQLLKTSKFYSKSKKCDIEKNIGGWVPPPPLGSQKVKGLIFFIISLNLVSICVFGVSEQPVLPTTVVVGIKLFYPTTAVA